MVTGLNMSPVYISQPRKPLVSPSYYKLSITSATHIVQYVPKRYSRSIKVPPIKYETSTYISYFNALGTQLLLWYEACAGTQNRELINDLAVMIFNLGIIDRAKLR